MNSDRPTSYSTPKAASPAAAATKCSVCQKREEGCRSRPVCDGCIDRMAAAASSPGQDSDSGRWAGHATFVLDAKQHLTATAFNVWVHPVALEGGRYMARLFSKDGLFRFWLSPLCTAAAAQPAVEVRVTGAAGSYAWRGRPAPLTTFKENVVAQEQCLELNWRALRDMARRTRDGAAYVVTFGCRIPGRYGDE